MFVFSPGLALDADRDFTGRWSFDATGSDTRSINAPRDRLLVVDAKDGLIRCSVPRADGTAAEWTYRLDGSETRYRIGEENRSSETKWEGRALLVNTNVSEPASYTISERWSLSREHDVLIVNRVENHGGRESEGVLRYRREGTQPQQPSTLVRPPAPPAPTEIVVKAGTRVPLSLRNAIDTKHSHEGDRVYLDTVFPIVVNSRIVIPQGSYVTGTLTTVKPAGTVKGKGELYIRFDSLILPNGTARDFRSRLASAETGQGKVDHKEGAITGERDKANGAKTTAEGAGIGAGVGTLAGAAAGHPITGAGIGAAAGAAAGIASVLLKHKPDASLPRGTTVEMLLDRDLIYQPNELVSR
jgi:type IV secretion system protein VirB10